MFDRLVRERELEQRSAAQNLEAARLRVENFAKQKEDWIREWKEEQEKAAAGKKDYVYFEKLGIILNLI